MKRSHLTHKLDRVRAIGQQRLDQHKAAFIFNRMIEKSVLWDVYLARAMNVDIAVSLKNPKGCAETLANDFLKNEIIGLVDEAPIFTAEEKASKKHELGLESQTAPTSDANDQILARREIYRTELLTNQTHGQCGLDDLVQAGAYTVDTNNFADVHSVFLSEKRKLVSQQSEWIEKNRSAGVTWQF